MTMPSALTIQKTLVDRAKDHTTAVSGTIASRLAQLQSAWARRVVGRNGLARSIAHLDDRLLADIGLSAEHLGFAERVARSRVTRHGRHFGSQ
jgi:uncharacterized protein YjiS (DUF1127 family)